MLNKIYNDVSTPSSGSKVARLVHSEVMFDADAIIASASRSQWAQLPAELRAMILKQLFTALANDDALGCVERFSSALQALFRVGKSFVVDELRFPLKQVSELLRMRHERLCYRSGLLQGGRAVSSDPDSLMNETMLRASYEMDLIATSRLDMNLFKKKLALARAVLSLQAMAEGMPETWMSTVKECSTMWWDRITIYIL